ncbi:5585_t:CDS:10 [Cetraspora pellucida]|uniref:Cap-specific mRNA (nucleoside-2'-O-)-methyltransferase 1 n=1 Tax=Cetraspora pellucida TaxID=1433469 RepID=A0A9N9EVA5_9GLOM|nr:5585_t:CDS:10 [Cetraspora pellucida]
MNHGPYTDEDPEYRNTPLVSPIPRPTLETCPPLQSQQHHRPAQYQQNYYGHNSYHSAPHISSTPSMHMCTPSNDLSNQQLLTPVEIQKQSANFLSCKIQYEEGKSINGLKIIVEPIIEPDYNQFCEAAVVQLLLDKKKALKNIPYEQFTAARGKSNPYEKVGHSIFMNRSASKLACLDALVNFTGVKRYDPVKDLVFWYTDLCGGPGGFSEYILWRKHSYGEKVYGWGITLTGDQDYDLNRFITDAKVRECFKHSYGADGTGNLYKEENIRHFANEVMMGTKNEGADLVTADGIITMFMTLQKNGDFVLKLFDVFTPFTAGMVWILYRHFEKICIIKPLSSRPANSERYIICRNLREHNPQIVSFLFDVNKRFNEIKSSSLEGQKDVNEVVEFDEMNQDEDFIDYLKMSNMKIAIKQTEALEELLKYISNPELKPPNQEEYRRLCFLEWRLPID